MLKPTDIFSFEDSIPISLIRQYCFCPRIPFFYLVYGISPELKPWVEEGLSFHERMSVLQRRRNLSSVRFDEGRFVPHVDVKSELLKFHGRVDGVFFFNSGDICPIEFKLAEKEEISYAFELYGKEKKMYDYKGNIMATAPYAFYTKEAIDRLVAIWCDNVIDLVKDIPQNVVNK